MAGDASGGAEHLGEEGLAKECQRFDGFGVRCVGLVDDLVTHGDETTSDAVNR